MENRMQDGALQDGITSRIVSCVNGLEMHVLEAGQVGAPVMLLLHGFPELSFSWRKVMVPLADAGFHVVAPDQRGYGRTTGWEGRFDADLGAVSMFGLVRDQLALMAALGVGEVACVVGHDFGSPVAAHAALARGDMFKRVVLMSAPYEGPPGFEAAPAGDIHADLLALDPPRKHYQWYYSGPSADADMRHAAQGLHAFMRAYYHCKSGDWAGNVPYPLSGWVASELAKMPDYYVMRADQDMAQSVLTMAPEGADCTWLTDAELAVYVEAFARTGFQPSLNWYRAMTSPTRLAELALFAGKKIEVPAMFIGGARDWGIYQKPGALEKMPEICSDFRGVKLVGGAGHWVQQEAADAVVDLIQDFALS